MKKQHTYLFKIVSLSFPEKLEALERNPEMQALPEEAAAKIKALLKINVGTLLKDPELPNSIKGLCVARLSSMASILKEMHSRPSENLLQDKAGYSFFSRYASVASNLQKALIKDRDEAGITFLGRSEKLFKWCRQELTETRNPLVAWLLGKESAPLKEKGVLVQFDKLSDILNSLILVVGACDDLADTIQDIALTNIVVKIIDAEDPTKDIDKETLKEDVAVHRGGIFKDYFDLVVTIWDDSICQLEEAFGESYFGDTVKPAFLDIFRSIFESLTYSVFMNKWPHNKTITVPIIHEKLAPNIMVCCFRYLEESLVVKLAADPEIGIKLPSESDLSILQSVINMSQESAASSNAAATAARELREGDLSTPFPFIINDRLTERLLEGQSFVQKFETYIAGQNYTNGFFATHYEEAPTSEFDYLTLLGLRRTILSNMLLELDKCRRENSTLPDSDYTIGTLAQEAIEWAKVSAPENLNHGKTLIKYKTHIGLIDSFSDSVALETNVYDDFFEQWEKDIVTMRALANDIKDKDLKEQTGRYIDSWQDFLCMYLLYKRAFDGTI